MKLCGELDETTHAELIRVLKMHGFEECGEESEGGVTTNADPGDGDGGDDGAPPKGGGGHP